MQKLRNFQIFQSVSFLIDNSFFKVISLLAFYYKCSGKNQATLSTVCLCISSAKKPISLLGISEFYLPQNSRTQIEFSQVLHHFIARIAFLPVPSNMFLISIWDPSEWPYHSHFTSILFINTLAFCKIEALSVYFPFFWALTRIASNIPFAAL